MSDRTLSVEGLDLLFLRAHTQNGWQDRPVDAALLHQLYDLARLPPTSANCQPLRVTFVASAAARERLRPTIAPGNLEKTMAAPVTAILAADSQFVDHVASLFPAYPAIEGMFRGMPAEVLAHVRTLNSGLQIGYFILAARSLGLDCGPMAGFNGPAVDAEFFPDGRFKSLVLCNLGYGDPAKVYPRGPRLDFETACRIE